MPNPFLSFPQQSVLITGGTGFLGSALSRLLAQAGHAVTVLSRGDAAFVAAQCGPQVRAIRDWAEAAAHYDTLINLAGAPIAGGRWTPARKILLRESRLGTTAAMAAYVRGTATPPRLVLQGSAIGYYGIDPVATFTENDAPTTPEFTHALCRDWEAAAAPVASDTTRLCILRTGVVLHPTGGALKQMLLPFRFGLGGRMGQGTQSMAWIARADWLGIVAFLMQRDTLHGVFNATSPTPVTNAEFTRILARQLHRPALFHTPARLLRALLGGDMADALLLQPPCALPARLLEAGYAFEQPTLEGALAQMLGAQAA